MTYCIGLNDGGKMKKIRVTVVGYYDADESNLELYPNGDPAAQDEQSLKDGEYGYDDLLSMLDKLDVKFEYDQH
ncbi:MAG TPA: hypothetical protein VI653_24065 [Steroidobacteraceae bacterium]